MGGAAGPVGVRRKRLTARRFIGVGAAIGALVTVLGVVLPPARFAYHSPLLHVALDTAEASIALLVAYLLLGRYRERRLLSDLGLVYALSVLGLTNVFFTVAPTLLHGRVPDNFGTWAPLLARLFGAGVLAASSFSRGVRVRRPRLARTLAAVACAGTLIAIAVMVLAASPHLPPGAEVTTSAQGSGLLNGKAHPAVLVGQLILMSMYLVAAGRFSSDADRTGDELLRWLGAGAVLAASARLNYALFPSLYSDYVYVGDVLRFGFYVFLLEGAMREIRAYWESRAEVEILEERRRVAHELHDGLAQELVYIAGQARAIQRGRGQDPRRADQLARGVDRAVAEARRAIATLTRPIDESFRGAVEELAEQFSTRADVEIEIDVNQDVEVSAPVREQLLRIAREALSNVIRHSHARSVTVRLSHPEEIWLRISDDGIGFDPKVKWSAQGGFGLVTMKERAEALGGRFRVRSSPGEGTTIEVEIPWENPSEFS